jgi:hypothetical protein
MVTALVTFIILKYLQALESSFGLRTIFFASARVLFYGFFFQLGIKNS